MKTFYLGLIMTWASIAGNAWGCSCAELPESEHQKIASAIFAGRVKSVTPLLDWGRLGVRERQVHFAVDTVWKGTVDTEVTVVTGNGGGDCGYDFVPGRYLVYATAYDDGMLHAGICSPTGPASPTSAPAGMGAGGPPVSIGGYGAGNRPSERRVWPLAAGLLLVGGGGLTFAWRHRIPRRTEAPSVEQETPTTPE